MKIKLSARDREPLANKVGLWHLYLLDVVELAWENCIELGNRLRVANDSDTVEGRSRQLIADYYEDKARYWQFNYVPEDIKFLKKHTRTWRLSTGTGRSSSGFNSCCEVGAFMKWYAFAFNTFEMCYFLTPQLLKYMCEPRVDMGAVNNTLLAGFFCTQINLVNAACTAQIGRSAMQYAGFYQNWQHTSREARAFAVVSKLATEIPFRFSLPGMGVDETQRLLSECPLRVGRHCLCNPESTGIPVSDTLDQEVVPF